MENFICIQCGTQFDATAEPPLRCLICEDERQFVHYGGQDWTTLESLAADQHNRFEDEAPQLLGIGTEPEFAIGQRALLLQSPGGNLLWDCISLLDEKTIAEVKARGGIRAIAISHPHFYSSMVEWAEHFNAQIFLHAADRQWVMRESPRILQRIEPFSFDQIYGGWWKANVLSDAKAAVARSAQRYLRAIASAGSYG